MDAPLRATVAAVGRAIEAITAVTGRAHASWAGCAPIVHGAIVSIVAVTIDVNGPAVGGGAWLASLAGTRL